jgi:putative hemolysin
MLVRLQSLLLVTAWLAGCGNAAAPAGQSAPPTGAAAAPSAPLGPVARPSPGDVGRGGPVAAIANPASTHCADVGGRLAIEKTPRGDEYGVCLFEDDRQCEEWALLRGRCPVGGRKITGYVTAAARYCAITGGRYDVTANSGADDEQGTCTLASGKVCAADAHFNGECSE